RDEDPVIGAVRRAQINKLVEIVQHALLAEHRVGDQTAADAAHGKTVGANILENMVGGFSAATTWHVFGDDGRLTGNMFFQIRKERAGLDIGTATRFSALDDGDGFALVERS